MTRKTAARTLPDVYFELVKRFPLTHIRDDDHLAEAEEVIGRLLTEDLDEGSQAYLDVLTDLIEAYEEEHVSIPDASEADVLRELMCANALSQSGLAKAAGVAQSHHFRRPRRRPFADERSSGQAGQVLPRLPGRLPAGLKIGRQAQRRRSSDGPTAPPWVSIVPERSGRYAGGELEPCRPSAGAHACVPGRD